MDTDKLKEYYTIESGKSLVRVSNLLITHIGVSVFFVLVFVVSLQGGNPSSLLFLNIIFVMFNLVVLGMSIYSVRMSGVNLIKSINPNYLNQYPLPEPDDQGNPRPEPKSTEIDPMEKRTIDIEDRWDNGSIRMKCTFVDGLKEGVCEVFWINGNKCSVEHFYKGKLHGLSEKYNDKGILTEKRTYEHGLKHGLYEIYSETGEITERGSFSNDRLTKRW